MVSWLRAKGEGVAERRSSGTFLDGRCHFSWLGAKGDAISSSNGIGAV